MATEDRKKWDKENKVFYCINLIRSTDSDIIDYLNTAKENSSIQGAIKEAIRFFLAYKDNINISTSREKDLDD